MMDAIKIVQVFIYIFDAAASTVWTRAHIFHLVVDVWNSQE